MRRFGWMVVPLVPQTHTTASWSPSNTTQRFQQCVRKRSLLLDALAKPCRDPHRYDYPIMSVTTLTRSVIIESRPIQNRNRVTSVGKSNQASALTGLNTRRPPASGPSQLSGAGE